MERKNSERFPDRGTTAQLGYPIALTTAWHDDLLSRSRSMTRTLSLIFDCEPGKVGLGKITLYVSIILCNRYRLHKLNSDGDLCVTPIHFNPNSLCH